MPVSMPLPSLMLCAAHNADLSRLAILSVSMSSSRIAGLAEPSLARTLANRKLMRRQYFSRFVNGRKFIWDVHRLVELTRDYPVKEVSLSRIHELDETFWFEIAAPTCRAVALHAKLIEETSLKHPIILSADARVMDGMHRVCKALLEHRATISAVQFERDPEPDYVDADIEALPYREL
jgi:hypothetical protein